MTALVILSVHSTAIGADTGLCVVSSAYHCYICVTIHDTLHVLWFQDELIWGAAWIYKASRSTWHWEYVASNIQLLGQSNSSGDEEFGWDDKHAGIYVLLYKVVILVRFPSSTSILLAPIVDKIRGR